MKEILLSAFVFLAFAYAQEAYIMYSGSPQSLYFTGDSINPGYWYKDAQPDKGNPDVTLRICGVGPKYVAATYAINVSGTWNYVVISYQDSTTALSYAGSDVGSGCYEVSPAGAITFSPSHLTTPTPNVYFAAFPARIWVLYSDTSTGDNPNFIFVPEANGYLRGSCTPKPLDSRASALFDRYSFDQATGNFEIDNVDITFRSQASSFTKQATDPTFGVSDERRMVIGVCDDQYGANCFSGTIVATASAFPLQLYSGASPIDDQHAYRRYIVVNGFGKLACIGADLGVSISIPSVSGRSCTQGGRCYYWSESVPVTVTVSNLGNVNITTPFKIVVNLKDPNGNVFKSWEFTKDDGLGIKQSAQYSVTWQAYNHSGVYTFEVQVDTDNNVVEWEDVSECSPYASSNVASISFELIDVTLVNIWINKNLVAYWEHTDSTFVPHGYDNIVLSNAGRPYEVTMHIYSSDEFYEPNPVPRVGTAVKFVEENGLSLLAPTQVWNTTLNGQNVTLATKVTNIVEVVTDDEGNFTLVLIPTGRKFELPEYSYLGINSSLLGNYSLCFSGTMANNEPLKITVQPGAEPIEKLCFNVTDMRYTSPPRASALDFAHLNSFVRLALNWISEIFGNAWRAIVP